MAAAGWRPWGLVKVTSKFSWINLKDGLAFTSLILDGKKKKERKFWMPIASHSDNVTKKTAKNSDTKELSSNRKMPLISTFSVGFQASTGFMNQEILLRLCSISNGHRIIDHRILGLEGTLRGLLIQPPAYIMPPQTLFNISSWKISSNGTSQL